MKSLAMYENPSSNPLQEVCFGFQVANFESKSYPERRLWLRKLYTRKFDQL